MLQKPPTEAPKAKANHLTVYPSQNSTKYPLILKYLSKNSALLGGILSALAVLSLAGGLNSTVCVASSIMLTDRL